MIITSTLVSFSRAAKHVITKRDEYEETVNTWFRATEEAIDDLKNVWLVLVNNELVVASKDEAIAIGYADCDETIKAVDEEIGFSWRHVTKEEAHNATKSLRDAGLLPPLGCRVMDQIRETIIARAESLGLTAYAIAKAIQDATGETVPDVGTVRRYITGKVSLNSRYVSLTCEILGLELRVIENHIAKTQKIS